MFPQVISKLAQAIAACEDADTKELIVEAIELLSRVQDNTPNTQAIILLSRQVGMDPGGSMFADLEQRVDKLLKIDRGILGLENDD